MAESGNQTGDGAMELGRQTGLKPNFDGIEAGKKKSGRELPL